MNDFNKIIIILLIFIVVILSAIMINIPVTSTTSASTGTNENNNEESVVMDTITYREIKESQTVFKVTARKGFFSFSRGEGRIENISGEIYLPENRIVSIKSDSGTILDNGTRIVLEKNVTGRMEDGTLFSSRSITYMVKENLLVTEDPVSLLHPAGTINAGRMNVDLNENKIHFGNNVNAVIKRFLNR